MESKYFSDLDSAVADDAVVFNGKQNRYVYSLEHSFNYNHSDTEIVLKILDVDGNFDTTFFNETFYQRLMNNSVNKYLEDTRRTESKTKISDFQIYVNDYLQSQIKIYLAYGIGDDLATWTDPIACTLVNADVDVANNGLRSYTYKFIPQINNFFRPEPEKDKSDPNRDVDFDFGALNARTEYAIIAPKLDDLNYNITELLKGFAGKVCNVNNDNVIVVIPNLIPKDITVSALVAGDTANQVSLKTVITEIKWTDKLTVGRAYLQTFKCIEATFPNSGIMTVKELIPVYKTRNKKDVEIAKNKELSDLIKKSPVLTNAEANFRNSGIPVAEKEKFIANNAFSTALETRQQLAKDKSDRQIDLNKITETINREVANGKTYDELQKLLKAQYDIKIEIKDLTKALGQVEGLFDDVASYNKLTRELKSLPQETYQDGTVEIEKPQYQIKLLMYAEQDLPTKDSNKPLIPNWRNSINKVFEGISKLNDLSPDSYIVPHISYETNLRWLKLFKKYNLISDPTKPCVIIGDRQMVLDYIYCNQVPLQNINNIKCKFKLSDNNPILKAHQTGYVTDIIEMTSRKRNSSSFSEKVYLDELDLSYSDPYAATVMDPSTGKVISKSSGTTNIAQNASKILDDTTKNLDIPIFINNFRNSNVISYSLKNSENYIAAIKFAVAANRLKYLASEFNENVYIELLKDAGINTPNPIELAKQFFDQTVSKLPEEIKDAKYNKITKDDIDLILSWEENENDNNARNNLNNSKYSLFVKSKIYKSKVSSIPISGKISPYLGINEYEKLPLILSQNGDNVSYLNLALQRTLFDTYGNKLNINELGAIAELIILLNAVNENNGGNTVSFMPGLTLPNTNVILAKLLEYQHKYATELTIKTLPFFNLTDSRTLLKPAIFYSKRISTLNSEDKATFDFFSGEYRILGFRHVINTQECYSEFLMYKHLASDETLKGHT